MSIDNIFDLWFDNNSSDEESCPDCDFLLGENEDCCTCQANQEDE